MLPKWERDTPCPDLALQREKVAHGVAEVDRSRAQELEAKEDTPHRECRMKRRGWFSWLVPRFDFSSFLAQKNQWKLLWIPVTLVLMFTSSLFKPRRYQGDQDAESVRRSKSQSVKRFRFDAQVGEVWLVECEQVGLMRQPDWDSTDGGDKEATLFWFKKRLVTTLGRGDRVLVCEKRKLSFLTTYVRVKLLRQSDAGSAWRPVLQGWAHAEWITKARPIGRRSDVE